MLPTEFTIADDFPAANYDEWRKLAEADLNGASFEQKLVTHLYEGIDIRPVYTRLDRPPGDDPHGLPGQHPFVRGSRATGGSWDLRQEHTHPDLIETNREILEDLKRGGVTSLLLRLDMVARQGRDPDNPAATNFAGRDGIMAYTLDDLDSVLTGVHLQFIGVALEAGAAFLPGAALLAALWQRRGVKPNEARGAFNADPFAVLVRDGLLPMSIDQSLSQMAQLAAATSRFYPQATAVRVGTAPYHHAGATAAQDLAFGIATGVEYLRSMTRAGLGIDEAARQILFSISLGTHHFLAIAKLRAARRLWSRVVEASGGSPEAGAMRLHARTSKRVLTERDPYVNLLRNTAAVFAAGLGGAEAITSVPFDAALGLPTSHSRRIARNTALILQEEANLLRVVDPAGGSWYLDWLTDELAAKAWGIFQQVEQEGGMLAAIRSGSIARQIDSAFAPRAKNLARRKEGITGVSEFPFVEEPAVNSPQPDLTALRRHAIDRVLVGRRTPLPAASAEPGEFPLLALALQGATIGQLAERSGFHREVELIPPLAPHPFAEPFEELRDASDAWAQIHHRRPRVFLANLGSAAHHTARATYAKNFFEAGGFEVIGNDGFREPEAAAAAFQASEARIAVVCSSDKLYPDLVPQVVPRLKAAGARSVVLAGNPGANEEAWRVAGVDRFIFIKCDVLTTLREMLREEGVLH